MVLQQARINIVRALLYRTTDNGSVLRACKFARQPEESGAQFAQDQALPFFRETCALKSRDQVVDKSGQVVEAVRGQRARRVFREELLWFDDAQSAYLTKVSLVEGGHVAPALQCRCPDDQVIEANHFSGGLQFGPDSSVYAVCSV